MGSRVDLDDKFPTICWVGVDLIILCFARWFGCSCAWHVGLLIFVLGIVWFGGFVGSRVDLDDKFPTICWVGVDLIILCFARWFGCSCAWHVGLLIFVLGIVWFGGFVGSRVHLDDKFSTVCWVAVDLIILCWAR